MLWKAFSTIKCPVSTWINHTSLVHTNATLSSHTGVLGLFYYQLSLWRTQHITELCMRLVFGSFSIKDKQQPHLPTSLKLVRPLNTKSRVSPSPSMEWIYAVIQKLSCKKRSRRSWCGRESSFAPPNACEVCFILVCLSFRTSHRTLSPSSGGLMQIITL